MSCFDIYKSLVLYGNVNYADYGAFLSAAIRAVRGRETPKPGTKARAVYADSYGCDLRIFYSFIAKEAGKIDEELSAFLGGRRVYYYDSFRTKEDRIKGIWEEYVADLVYCADGYEGEINHVLVTLCQEESNKNRAFLKKFCEYGQAVSVKLGVCKEYSVNNEAYLFEEYFDDKKFSMFFERRSRLWDHIMISYDGKPCFTYNWNCKIDSYGLADNKGRFVHGAWENLLEKLYFSL